MLDPFSRGTMIALSTLCVAGAVASAPLRARSSSALPGVQLAELAPMRTLHDGREMVIRDPFAEPTPALVSNPVPAAAAPSRDGEFSPDRALLSASTGDTIALPSNLPRDTIPGLPGSAADTPMQGTRITAIVTGAHPYAMLEAGGVHALKGIGDHVNGVAVRAIDIGGITLQNGQRLRVDAAGRP